MTARTKIAAGLTVTLGLLTLALTVTPVNPHRAEAAPAAVAEPVGLAKSIRLRCQLAFVDQPR